MRARATWGGMYIKGQVKGAVEFYTAILCAMLMTYLVLT